jgi:pullulanase/glycogen debranching enzyme
VIVVGPGRSRPAGAHVVDGGVSFSVSSEYATRVELLLFERPDDAEPAAVGAAPATLAFRKRQPELRRDRFLDAGEIRWHGGLLDAPGWSDPSSRLLAFTPADAAEPGAETRVERGTYLATPRSAVVLVRAAR